MIRQTVLQALRGNVVPYAVGSLLICATVLVRFYWPAQHGLDVTGHQIGRDFINNWAGPQLAFSGRLATLFDLPGYVDAISELFGQPLPFHNWGYPPFTLLWFWPLAQLPYFWALAAWTVGLFVAYVAVGMRFVAPDRRLAMLFLLACAPATIINAVGGQNGFLTAALFLGGILALERRPILAGVLFGLLTAKPQLGLVLPLVLLGLGAWRTIAVACGTTAMLVGVSILAFGMEPWRQYLTATSAYQLSLLQDFSNGFYRSMMTSVLAEARTFGASFSLAAVLQTLVGVPVALVAAWAAVRTRDPRQRAFVLASAAPLVTPYAFNYDLTALSLILSWRIVEGPMAASWKDLVLRIAWLMPIVLMLLNWLGFGLAPLVLLAVFAIAVVEATSDLRRSSSIDDQAPLAA